MIVVVLFVDICCRPVLFDDVCCCCCVCVFVVVCVCLVLAWLCVLLLCYCLLSFDIACG